MSASPWPEVQLAETDGGGGRRQQEARSIPTPLVAYATLPGINTCPRGTKDQSCPGRCASSTGLTPENSSPKELRLV
ncbi:hypothetical protein J6590_077554 [Homalodisca vitripennis]|nr:hypothetical protein J6590_077554 [Homalodisca vitripennis]